VLRGGLLASSGAALAVAAHGLAGGGWPDTGFTLLLTVLLAGAGTALADRRRGLPAILGALGAAQLGMHVLLSAAHPHHAGVAAGLPWPGMTASHAVAVLLTAVLLAKAEAAVFAVASALGALLPRRPLPAPVNTPRPGVVVAPLRVDTELDVLFHRVCLRRGPPVCS
jgi:hypothetical protein